MLAVPTLQPVRPDAPPPGPAPAPPAAEPEPMFYVLAAGGVWGPVTSTELATIAETAYALTGAEVVVTPA